MNIVLIGSQGIGKGTYASILQKKLSIPHISSGDIFRTEIKNQTEVGKKIKDLIDKGNLVPDELTIKVIEKRLAEKDSENGFLLDGFPRNVHQAEALEKIKKINFVLHFVADEKVIIERLSTRIICKDCQKIYNLKNIPPKVEGKCDKCNGDLYQRDDDKPKAIKKRLEIFKKSTQPIIDFYKKKNVLYQFNANLDINNPKFSLIDDCISILGGK